MNRALGFCTRPVLVPGSIWPNRCSASSSDEPWRAITSTMSRSSRIGSATPSRGGIVILPRSSGEASGMPAAIAPMPVVIDKGDQELPPSMCFRAVFVRCVITGTSAMPSHMASDPLVPSGAIRQAVAATSVAAVSHSTASTKTPLPPCVFVLYMGIPQVQVVVSGSIQQVAVL